MEPESTLLLALVQRQRPANLIARDPVRVGGDPVLQRLRRRGGPTVCLLVACHQPPGLPEAELLVGLVGGIEFVAHWCLLGVGSPNATGAALNTLPHPTEILQRRRRCLARPWSESRRIRKSRRIWLSGRR